MKRDFFANLIAEGRETADATEFSPGHARRVLRDLTGSLAVMEKELTQLHQHVRDDSPSAADTCERVYAMLNRLGFPV